MFNKLCSFCPFVTHHSVRLYGSNGRDVLDFLLETRIFSHAMNESQNVNWLYHNQLNRDSFYVHLLSKVFHMTPMPCRTGFASGPKNRPEAQPICSRSWPKPARHPPEIENCVRLPRNRQLGRSDSTYVL